MSITKLYHVSPSGNRYSILNSGLSTRQDRRYKGKIWLSSWTKLLWSMNHVSENHKVPMSDLDIYEVTVKTEQLERRRKGIYNYATNINPNNIKRI